MSLIFVNPEQMKKPAAYSHGALAEGSGRTLYVAGQIPLDAADQTPETFEAQAKLVFTNIKCVLDAAGMTLSDIVKMTTFLVRREDAPSFQSLRGEFMQGAKPPSTLVFVSGLGRPQFLIEVEVTAFVPA